MIKPWKVCQELRDLLNPENNPVIDWAVIEGRIIQILEDDDPDGMWVSGADERDRGLLAALGIGWDEIKDIFEEELTNQKRDCPACQCEKTHQPPN